jgi:hypothetical protein
MFLAYIIEGGFYGTPVRLLSASELVAFIKKHLYAEELRITDCGDNLIYHAVNGIDLYSDLESYGIDLPEIYREIRAEWVNRSADNETARQPWEDFYDSIGLSAGEYEMRQKSKRAAKSAKTVQDVAYLLEDTYFDAFFTSEDSQRAWGYFRGGDFSAVTMVGDEISGWQGDWERVVHLSPGARVRHKRSGEDSHWFILLDEP